MGIQCLRSEGFKLWINNKQEGFIASNILEINISATISIFMNSIQVLKISKFFFNKIFIFYCIWYSFEGCAMKVFNSINSFSHIFIWKFIFLAFRAVLLINGVKRVQNFKSKTYFAKYFSTLETKILHASWQLIIVELFDEQTSTFLTIKCLLCKAYLLIQPSKKMSQHRGKGLETENKTNNFDCAYRFL